MSSYENIYTVLNGPEQEWIGYRLDELTVDQRIAAAQVIALASIAEELSGIKHHGIAQSGQESSPAAPRERKTYRVEQLK